MPRIPLTEDQLVQVRLECSRQDFQWWYNRTKIKQAKEQLEKAVGFSVAFKVFRQVIAAGHCDWFLTMRRRAPVTTASLSESEWKVLRDRVDAIKHNLYGRTIDEAVAIVSACKGKCNRTLLEGLRKESRYWEHTC
jgi:hypothetical protein